MRAGRRGRAGRGRDHRLHPELIRTAGPVALPHVVRAERAQAPGRDRRTSPASWPPSWGWTAERCKRGAFLHDIGKALTHEVGGQPRDRSARSWPASTARTTMSCTPSRLTTTRSRPQTVEAVLTQASDAVAVAGRVPGASRLEAYVKRLERIEEIAMHHDGVEKVFAMQAGREIRVMVLPDDGRRHRRPGDGTRRRQADRGGADLPRSDPGHGGPRVPRHRGRQVASGSITLLPRAEAKPVAVPLSFLTESIRRISLLTELSTGCCAATYSAYFVRQAGGSKGEP